MNKEDKHAKHQIGSSVKSKKKKKKSHLNIFIVNFNSPRHIGVFVRRQHGSSLPQFRPPNPPQGAHPTDTISTATAATTAASAAAAAAVAACYLNRFTTTTTTTTTVQRGPVFQSIVPGPQQRRTTHEAAKHLPHPRPQHRPPQL
jgi:hypothetical protein